MTPGPIERRLWSRIVFRVTGSWPQSVVVERLAAHDARVAEMRRSMDARGKVVS